MNTTLPTTRTIDLGNGLQLTIDEKGDAVASGGTGILVLHGGGGPESVAGLAAGLAEHAYVVTPVHPGFAGGTPQVPWLRSVGDLADAYLDLLGVLGLDLAMVIGNSLGGWIGSEMALRDIHGQVTSLVLLNAVGIRPDNDQQFTDIRTLPPAEVGKLAFANPAFRPDPATMSQEQLAGMAANQAALASYAGEDFIFEPGLRRRLHRVSIPVLVAWGVDDGVVTAEYGRSYAASFANGRFQAIAEAGHFPHIEQPAAVLSAIGDFADTMVKPN
jgi:pimeloyl-ACP methyl ester carboxylesterase